MTASDADRAREALATALDRADDRWQHGIGSGGYDMSTERGYFLMLADAALAALGQADQQDGA